MFVVVFRCFDGNVGDFVFGVEFGVGVDFLRSSELVGGCGDGVMRLLIEEIGEGFVRGVKF